MTPPLIITRQVKINDLNPILDPKEQAHLYPSSITVTKKTTSVITPIPGEQHLPIPIGPEAKEILIEAPWNLNNPPCPEFPEYKDSLKNWTCNSIYTVTTLGSLVQEEIDGHYLAKAIGTTRDKTGMAGAKSTWKLNMNLIKLRDVDVVDCPAFNDTTVSSTIASTGATPYIRMVNLLAPSEVIQVGLIKIVVKHQGSIQSFPLYDCEALTILPPLGNIGPVIDITFRVNTVAMYTLIKAWAAYRSLVVSTTQNMYPEFDNDGTGYDSKWIVNNISIARGSASGAGVVQGQTLRIVSMSLTRYWRYADMVGA